VSRGLTKSRGVVFNHCIGSDALGGGRLSGMQKGTLMTTIDLRPTYGDYVRKARKEAGLSQAEVAGALGTSLYRVSRWENDQERPRLDEHMRFAELTDTSVDLGELLITWNSEMAGQAA
jgi:DNA-binding XRE family transcriptional regulator